METLRFDYRPKLWTSALAGLAAAVIAATLSSIALGNDRGLVIDGIIRLDIGDATIFYWVMAGLCALGVAVALLLIVRSLGAPQEVVLNARVLSAPKSGLSTTVVTVPLTTITDLRITEVKSQKFLIVRHTAGKLKITRSMLPDHAAFETLIAAIDQRCRAMRGR